MVCPECASLNVKEDIYNSTRWRGLFKISYSGKIYSCKDCNCNFKIGKDRTRICDCSWDELFGWMTLFTSILWIVLIIISVTIWGNADLLPSPMAAAIAVDTIMVLASLFTWIKAI